METLVTAKWREMHQLWEKQVDKRKKLPWESLEADLERLYQAGPPAELSKKTVSRFLKAGLLSTENLQQPVLRRILDQLLGAFKLSSDFNLIAERLGITIQAENICPCLVLWAFWQYPKLSTWVLGPWVAQAYSGLIGIPFNQFIRYAPTFVLCRLTTMMENPDQVIWVRWMAMGKNIRKAPHLPFPLSKRMAHWLTQAPHFSTFPQALIFAQVKGLGGSEDLCQFIQAFYRDSNNNWHFRTQVVSFLVRYETALNPGSLSSLLGYLEHCRQEISGYSLKGRTLSSLLRQMTAWELERHYEEEMERWSTVPMPASWPGIPYPDYQLGMAAQKYCITQLTSVKALIEEGIHMHHCVASYAYACSRNECSIWSLRQCDATGNMERLVTIQLDKAGRVVQTRRAYNAMPKEQEMEMIRRWEEGLGELGWFRLSSK